MAGMTPEQAFELIANLSQQHYGKTNKVRAEIGMAPHHIATVEELKNAPYFDPYRQLKLKVPGGSSGGSSATKDSTDKLQGSDLVREQLATEQAKLAGAGKAGSGGRHWWDDWAENTLGTAASAIDYLSRPVKAVTSGLYELGQEGEHKRGADEWKYGANMWSNVWSRGVAGFFDEPGAKTGEDIIKADPDYQKMSGGWQKSALGTGGGLVTDIALDPFSWVSGGTTALGKEAALKAVAKIGEEGTIAKGLRAAVEGSIAATEKGGTVARGTKSLTSAELKAQVAKEAVKNSNLKSIRNQVTKQVKRESDDLHKRTGHYMPPADRAARLEQLSLEATDRFQNQLTRTLEAANKRRLAVRIGGHDILGGTKLGQTIGRDLYKPLEVLGKTANKSQTVRGIKEAFQVGSHFPGWTNRIRRLAESRGIKQHEVVSKEIDNMLKGLSHKTQKMLYKDLERGVRTTGEESGKDLAKIYDYFDNMRREHFYTLEEMGIYKPSDAVENFVPQYYRRGSTSDIKAYKEKRKLALRGQVGLASDYGVDAAKEAGLHPYDMVGDAFKMNDAEVTRQVMRRNNQIGLVNEYGVRAKEGAAEYMKSKGLVEANDMMAPADRELMKAAGESMWIHPEIRNTTKAMDEMLKAGNHDDLNRLMRLLDRVTNWWKRTATVYNPGNWFNNSIGDITMNFIDGAQNPMDYIRAGRIVLGKDAGMMIPLAKGVEIDSGLFKHLYEQYASGAGYLRAEVGTDVASRLTHKLGKGFEAREDFGRMAHFMHALRDEISRTGELKGLNKYLKSNPSPQEMLKTAFGRKLHQAANAAGDRVAKWNIDYSAFTPAERKLKKIIPFYAWQRKSIPLLLEGMATKPGRITAVRKIQNAASEFMGGNIDEQQGQYNVAYPFWLRQMGFMRMSGGKYPTTIQDPTPLSMWGKTFGAASIADFLRQQAGGLNPAIKVPLEIAYNKQSYSGAKLPADMKQYWLSQLPIFSAAGMATGSDIRGNELDPGQRLGQFFGSKPYDVTDKVQAGELQRQKDPYDARMSKLNKALKESPQHVVIRKVKDGYKVVNEVTGYSWGTIQDPGRATALAVQVAGLNK